MLTLPRIDAGRVDYYEGRAPDPQVAIDGDGGLAAEEPGAAAAAGYEGYLSGRHDSETTTTGRVVDERSGRWVGDLAGRLGLTGEVGYGELSALLDQRHPHSGQALGRRVSDRVRRGPDGREQTLCARAGWDAQWAPPKSVSALWALGDDEVSSHVEQAIDAAVEGGLRYLQDQATFTRVGPGGERRIRAEGLIGAAYRHDTSRSADPQYHVHVVIPNVTHADGRWLRLDEHALNVHRFTADRVFQAHLRAELSERLGVQWAVGRTEGTYEIAGVSRTVIDELSQRRAQILERVGADASAGAREAAALDTRHAKGTPQDLAELREGWRVRAAEHGLGRDQVAGLTGRPPGALDRGLSPTFTDELAGARGLTRDQSVFEGRHVISAIAAARPAGARYRQLSEHAAQFLERRDVQVVEPADQPGRRALAVGDRYSTSELLDLERELLERAEAGANAGVARPPTRDVDAAVSQRPELNAEQATLVRQLTQSGARIDVVRAGPGTGKTFALDAAREAFQRAGIPVYGTALSARAAAELEAGAGMPATTIAKLRSDIEHGDSLAPGSVLIVDEAGMVGTRDFAWLLDQVERADGKLAAVGDTRQLPEIEAGGVLRSLGDRLGASQLKHIQRQEQPWDRDAIAAFHRGDHRQWIAAQVDHGRVTVAASAPAAREAMIAAWARDTQLHGPAGTLMLADRRDSVRELNGLARQHMRQAGRLGERELRVAGRAFAQGDRVLTLRNHPGIGVRNGDRATVLNVAEDGTLTISLDGDRPSQTRVPADYIAGGHLDYGYAATIHKTQGATLQTIHHLGSEHTFSEAALTAGSRHRIDYRLYLVDGDLRDQGKTLDDGQARWRGDLERLLGRSRAKELATDVRDRAQALRDQPTEQLRDEERVLAKRVAPYPTEAWRARDARQRADQARQAADAAQHRAETTPTPTASQAAAQLSDLARHRNIDATRLEELDRVWTEHYAQPASELVARRAELERRQTLQAQARAIAARHDPDLRRSLEEQLGPRPDGLDRRDEWDAAAHDQLAETHDVDPPGPELPPPEPDLGVDL